MRMFKLALVVTEHLLVFKFLQGHVVPTSSFKKSDAFEGELLDEFPTASLVKCLKTCDADWPKCQAGRYNADSGQCQRLVNATSASQVTWLSDGIWTVFQKTMCALGWSTVHQSCYQTIHGTASRQGASDGCRSLGGYLAVISDDHKKTAIQGFLTSLGFTSDTDRFYVDGSDAETEGVWLTEAGDVMKYTGIDIGDPNGGTTKNCLFVRSSKLGDYSCTRNLSAICEM